MNNHQLSMNKKMSNEDQFLSTLQEITVRNDDMHLYWASGSIPSWRIRIVLNEKQIDHCQQRMISLDQHEHKTKPLIEQNRRGHIPSFKIGNLILNESLAVCLHLEKIMKNQGIRLLPDDLHLKAQVFQCLFDSLRLLKFGCEDLIYYIWHTPSERVDQDLLIKRKMILIEELIQWNNRYEETHEEIFFAIGTQFTLADVFLFPQLALFVHCGYPIRLHSRINLYYEHLRQRPSIKNSFPPHWLKHTSNILADCVDLFPKTDS